MATGIRALQKIGLGFEDTSTPGTIVVSSTRWRGLGMIQDTLTQVFPEEAAGNLGGSNLQYIASYGGEVHLWNASSHQHLGSLQVGEHPLSLAFDAGGEHLYVANETRTLSRWDVALDPRSQVEVARWATTLHWQLDGDALVSPGRGRP